jgi:SAM-dependent methyltransferase
MLTTKAEANTPSVTDATSAVEVGRLLDQDQLITKVIGGVFPERLDLTNVYRILDLACGPGGWALEAARHLEVPCVGVDRSPAMIEYARMMAKIGRLSDIATFQQMDITQPLAFDDGAFDLIHARFLAGFSLPRSGLRCYASVSECSRWEDMCC